MKRTLRTIEALEQHNLVDPGQRGQLERVAARYAVGVSTGLAGLIDRTDPNDPISRQFIPDERELMLAPEEDPDPIGDNAHSPVEGIVRYISRAVLRFSEPAGNYQEAWQRLPLLREDVFSRHTLSNIITGQGLYARERASQPLEEIILNMRNRDLRTTALNDSEFGVSFAADDPRQAQAAVHGVVAALMEANLRAGRSHAVNMEVLEPASLPAKPAGPNRGTLIGAGLAVGLAFGILCGGVWSLVRRRGQWSWKYIAAFAAVGAAAGIAIAIRIPDEFISTAFLRAGDAGTMRRMVGATLSKDSLAGLIRREGLYARERAAGGLDRAADQMRKNIRVQAVENGTARAIVVSFRGRDRYEAQRVTRDLVTELMKVPGTPVEVLDPPSMPQSPIFPNRPVIAAAGGFAGLVLGIGAASWRRKRASSEA